MPNAPIIQATEIRLYRFPNVDISHQNVTVFQATGTSTAEQVRDALFGGLDKISVYDFSFLKNNKVRVPYALTQIQNYNYLSYKNPAVDGTQTAAGLHRIYCFIVDMEFVNPSTTEITFEVDYWYTYSPFLSYPMGFVERCHPNNDNWGSNREGEPIEPGLMRAVGNPAADPLSITSLDLCLLTTFEDFIHTDAGGIWRARPVFFGGRGCSCLKLWHWNLATEEGQQHIRTFFARFNDPDDAEFADGIVAAFVAPHSIIAEGGWVNLSQEQNLVDIELPENIQGTYEPRWQKTRQYPYVYASAAAGSNVQTYQFELSNRTDHTIRFGHCGVAYGQAVITGVPINYKGKTYYLEESISLSDFPQVAWNSSTYAQWLNENGTKQATSGIMSAIAGLSGIVGIAGGIATMNPAAIVAGGIGIASAGAGISNTAESFKVAQSQAPAAHGTPDANSLIISGWHNIHYSAMTIFENQARRIDAFFDRYGYAQNQTLSVGLLFGRNSTNSNYNGSYVKTKNYSVHSGGWFVPARALEYISALFNRGITFFPNSTIFPS